MAEKGKPRGAGAKSKPDKSRTSARAQGRQSKKTSPKSPRHTSAHHTPSPDDAALEPLDAGPILDALLDRVLTECAVAAAAQQRVPFTVSRARDAILFVAEWRFLARDEGDPDREGDPDPERDGIWSEDEEPQTCPVDRMAPNAVPVDYEGSESSEESSSEEISDTAEAESPLVSPGEDQDAVPVRAVPLFLDHVTSEDFPVIAEAESPLVSPGEDQDAVPVPAATLPPELVPSAAAAAAPAQALGADIDEPEPGPPRPESPVAPRPRERGRQLSRDSGRGGILAQPPKRDRRLFWAPERGSQASRPPGKGGILAQPPKRGRRLSWAPERGSQPSRPPRPRPAPLNAPRPRAPLPTAPSERPAQAPQVSREGTAKVRHQLPPLPPSGPSLAPMQPRRPSLDTGVPRLGARRVAARRVLPEVRVVDVSAEPEWGRAGARLFPWGATQVLPGAGRARRAEPQLCDPWLASARLAPGVTVRWGRSERRGPPLPGHDRQGDDEQDDEAVKRSDKELKPILAYPECRLSEYDE